MKNNYMLKDFSILTVVCKNLILYLSLKNWFLFIACPA